MKLASYLLLGSWRYGGMRLNEEWVHEHSMAFLQWEFDMAEETSNRQHMRYARLRQAFLYLCTQAGQPW